jgi:hypothetical protein
MSSARSRRILLLLAGVWTSAWIAAAGSAEPVANRLERYLQAVQRDLPPQAVDALNRVEGTPRRLLAARGYLRGADRLASRWSWSEGQIERYERSAEHEALLAEVKAVQARFERANPGYQLYANTEVRSLDLQLERWNTNPSIEAASQALRESAVAELNARSYSKEPDAASTRKFARFLSQWMPPTALPLAAPGLSLHGQARAIDFQVMKDGDIVAGTETSSIDAVWSKRGWTRKLRRAVQGTRFKGPLAMPNEPWHYEYQP